MRILIFILAFLGAAGSGFIGFASYDGIESRKRTDPNMTAAGDIVDLDKLTDAELQAKGIRDPKLLRAGASLYRNTMLLVYSLCAAAVLGLLGGFLAIYRQKMIAALILIVGGGAPIFFAYRINSLLESEFKAIASSEDKTRFMVLLAPGALLVLTGLLCFLIKPAVKKVKPSAEEDEEEPPLEEDEAPAKPAKKRIALPDEPASPAIQAPSRDITEKKPTGAPTPPPSPVAVFKCPKCGKVLKKTDPQAGKPIKCPGCANTFPLPLQAVEKARVEHQKARDAYIAAKEQQGFTDDLG